jgi:hypothetical protein
VSRKCRISCAENDGLRVVSARRPEPYRVRPLGGTRHRPYVVTWKDSSSGCSGETVGQGLL